MNSKNLHNPAIATWALRAGLIFVFLYAGVESLLHPLEWTGYLPGFLVSHFSSTLLIRGFAIVEIVLAAWLIVGKYLKIAAALCALMMIGILIVNTGQLIVTFRDVGLALMAVALVFID